MLASAEYPFAEVSASKTAAAKLHVLNLAPIKTKLDVKWPKLSALVHKLFEKSIRDAQGPRDHFIQLDELAYVVTFHGLAFEEASLACAAIAQEVCEKLFGGIESGISVRALVGELSDQILAQQFGDGAQISALLELNGQEIVVTSNPADTPPITTQIVPGRHELDWEPLNTITKARHRCCHSGCKSECFQYGISLRKPHLVFMHRVIPWDVLN